MTQQRKSTEQRRTEIADAALEIIAREGLRRFTVARISERVDLAEGTIFRHFEDMDDIVLESVDRLQELLFAGAGDVTSDGDDPLERLEQFLTQRIGLITDRPEVLKLLFSDDFAKVGPDEATEQIRRLKRQSMTFVLNQFREAQKQGRVSEEASPEDLLFIAHGTALASVFSTDDIEAVADGEVEPKRALEALFRLLRT